MTNAEVFDKFHTEKWVLEQNLCFMLQDYWDKIREKTGIGEKLPSQMPINPVTFVKAFMKEETIMNVPWAEKSKMDNIMKHPENIIEAEFTEIT
jgi:hypothetical protein